MTDKQKTQRLEMRVSPEFLKKVDKWRAKQDDVPPRAEAIRRLVDIGIAVSEKNLGD